MNFLTKRLKIISNLQRIPTSKAYLKALNFIFSKGKTKQRQPKDDALQKKMEAHESLLNIKH